MYIIYNNGKYNKNQKEVYMYSYIILVQPFFHIWPGLHGFTHLLCLPLRVINTLPVDFLYGIDFPNTHQATASVISVKLYWSHFWLVMASYHCQLLNIAIMHCVVVNYDVRM